MGIFCLIQSPLVLGYLYSLVAVEEIEEKTRLGLLENAEEGLSLGPLFTFPSLPYFRAAGVLGDYTPELPGKFVLGSCCPFISSWFILLRLEPWLMVFIACLCSLFTLPNVSAVHTTQGSHCSGRNCLYVWRLGGHITALFFLTSFRHRFFFPFASCHMMRVGNQNLCRIACEKSWLQVTQESN